MGYNFIHLSTLFTAWTTSQGKNVLLSQFDKSIFCAMGKCSEITAHVLRRNCWVNSVHCKRTLAWRSEKFLTMLGRVVFNFSSMARAANGEFSASC